jgi:hypothetical protein
VVKTDAHGNVFFVVDLSAATTRGQVISATATDPGGDTSEFSAVRTVIAIAGSGLLLGQGPIAAATLPSFGTNFWSAWNPNVTCVKVQVGDFTRNGQVDVNGFALQTDQRRLAHSSASNSTNDLWDQWSPDVTWVDA